MARGERYQHSNRVWKNNDEKLEELINMSKVRNPGSVNITTNTNNGEGIHQRMRANGIVEKE